MGSNRHSRWRDGLLLLGGVIYGVVATILAFIFTYLTLAIMSKTTLGVEPLGPDRVLLVDLGFLAGLLAVGTRAVRNLSYMLQPWILMSAGTSIPLTVVILVMQYRGM